MVRQDQKAVADQFNILVIEDNDDTFKLIGYSLAASNYKLWRAASGSEALKMAKEMSFMLIITELHLADIDGVELIKRLKKMEPLINIVILATSSFTEERVKALQAGAFSYVLKPINAEELKITIQRAIENSCLLIQAGKRRFYQDMSILDGLTGIYNHRHFHEMLDWQISHMRRNPQTFCLLMIDIDDFKKYNDAHGHPEGDKLLHNMAQLFINSTRESDLVFRYGGEEFAIVLPQTPAQHSRKVGERLVDTVRVKLPVTISIGLATFPDDAQEKMDLVKKADSALYQAKSLGKNKFCVFTQKPR